MTDLAYNMDDKVHNTHPNGITLMQDPAGPYRSYGFDDGNSDRLHVTDGNASDGEQFDAYYHIGKKTANMDEFLDKAK
jgi:hypothetical protein